MKIDYYPPAKHPDSIEPYFVVYCDLLGTNISGDDGELQGETIATATFTVPTGITKVSSNSAAVTIDGVSYAVNTVATVWLSGGTDLTDYACKCVITTATRTLAREFTVPVRARPVE